MKKDSEELPHFKKERKSSAPKERFLKILFFLVFVFIFLGLMSSFFRTITFDSWSREEVTQKLYAGSREEQVLALGSWLRNLNADTKKSEWLPVDQESSYILQLLGSLSQRKKKDPLDERLKAALWSLLKLAPLKKDQQATLLKLWEETHPSMSSEEKAPAMFTVAQHISSSKKEAFVKELLRLRLLPDKLLRKHVLWSSALLKSRWNEKLPKELWESFVEDAEASIRNQAVLFLMQEDNAIVHSVVSEWIHEIDSIEGMTSALSQEQWERYKNFLEVLFQSDKESWQAQVREWAQKHPHVKIQSHAQSLL